MFSHFAIKSETEKGSSARNRGKTEGVIGASFQMLLYVSSVCLLLRPAANLCLVTVSSRVNSHSVSWEGEWEWVDRGCGVGVYVLCSGGTGDQRGVLRLFVNVCVCVCVCVCVYE